MFPWESIIECSGSHLSTALALELLEQYLLDVDTFPESMIDLGIGKGILACSLPLRCFERTGVDFETEVFVDQARTVN